MNGTLKIAAASIAVGLVVLGLKLLAWRVTGSVALYSDALESLVNVATAIAALVAVRVAAQPADANHPYGHHKAEYFSAVLAGVLIMVAAIAILREAWHAMNAPSAIVAPVAGLAISVVASLINAAWAWMLISNGRRLRSPALAADGRHLRADVVTSIGVVVGIAAAVLTGWSILDPALAGIVALNILWSGWRVIRESLGGLMDAAVPEDQLGVIRSVIAEHANGAIEAHDVRSRTAGALAFVDFHLVVPALMTVGEAHDICDRIERALQERLDGITVTIHVEPEEKAKHSGIVVL